MRNWTDSERGELANLFHLARVPLSGTGKDTPYERRKWAARKFAETHPEVSSTAAYKELCREAAWRHQG
jgi:hypothetical protein